MKQENFRLRPTALWLIFGPVLGCMWLAAVNYSNNLVYAILFLIAALSFVSIFHTWRNLAPLRVEHIRIQPAFAGEEVRMEIHLRNPARHTIYGLFFSRVGDEAGLPRRPTPLRSPGSGRVRIGAMDSCSAEVVFPAERRGMYRFESLLVRTAYPLGLFWASFRVPVNAEYFIYPQAKGNADWPELHPSGEQGSPASMKPGDDFSGVRTYQPGESLRHVDWKAYARGRPLSVKQFTGGSGHELWLDAAEMSRLPLEARLSQLALWIVNAEKAEIPYALKLGRTTLPLGLGPAQSRRALEALAVAGAGSA
ncbi:MAG: DUF58 domain-containing protein [Methylacidiphilales bacterium]|nr:DUF58 domain-containing protein [Candidatus Methylacidiphilales bacterium]